MAAKGTLETYIWCFCEKIRSLQCQYNIKQQQKFKYNNCLKSIFKMFFSEGKGELHRTKSLNMVYEVVFLSIVRKMAELKRLTRYVHMQRLTNRALSLICKSIGGHFK